MELRGMVEWVAERDEYVDFLLNEMVTASDKALHLWQAASSRVESDSMAALERMTELQVLLESSVRPAIDDLLSTVVAAAALLGQVLDDAGVPD